MCGGAFAYVSHLYVRLLCGAVTLGGLRRDKPASKPGERVVIAVLGTADDMRRAGDSLPRRGARISTSDASMVELAARMPQ